MKALALKISVAIALAQSCWFSLDSFSQELESLITTAGKEYFGVTVSKVGKDSVSLTHAKGLATVKIRNLPRSFRIKFGIFSELEFEAEFC